MDSRSLIVYWCVLALAFVLAVKIVRRSLISAPQCAVDSRWSSGVCPWAATGKAFQWRQGVWCLTPEGKWQAICSGALYLIGCLVSVVLQQE
jgi:hypothetical protein